MDFWLEFLPIIIYILLIIVLLIGIVLGIKFIITLGKFERVVDDVQAKVKTLDTIFNIIDNTTDKIVLVTDKVLDGITNAITKLFFGKKEKEETDVTVSTNDAEVKVTKVSRATKKKKK